MKDAANNPTTVKLWSKKLQADILAADPIWSLIGTGPDCAIQLKEDSQKSAGDMISYFLRAPLKGGGISEGERLELHEESLIINSDKLHINELAHAVKIRNMGTIDHQRIPFNLREEATAAIRDWYSNRLATMIHMQLGGYSGKSLLIDGVERTDFAKYNGFNDITPPSAENIVLPDGVSSENRINKDHIMTLSLIDKAVEKAKLASPKLRPIKISGGKYYILYLHPRQVTQLRTNTNAGQWLDIQKAVYSGAGKDNPIFNGSLGVYNGVILRESNLVVPGVKEDNTPNYNVRRAVFLGAQAAVIAFGQGFAGQRYQLVEQLFDYQRELGIAAKTIVGIKKTSYNNKDYAVLVLPSYVAN